MPRTQNLQMPRKKQAKNNNKKAKPKKNVVKSGNPSGKIASSTRQSVAPPRNPAAGITSICALTDPFCEHAHGVKYPDASNSRSLPFSMHYQINSFPDLTGNSSTLFLPGYNFGFAYATTTSSIGACAFPATLTANNVNSVAASSYRIVLAGIRMRNLISPLNSSGIVQIRGYSSPTGASYSNVNTGLYNCDFYADIPLQSINNNGHTDVILRRIDEMESRMFISPLVTNPTSTLASWTSPGFGAIVITVLGGPVSASALNFEVFQHMEVILDDSDSLSVAMTPPNAPNPVLAQAAGTVSRTMGNIFHQIGKDVETVAIGMARKFMVGVGSRAFAALPMLMM